jgi:CheY-like chemotaxis protein
LTRILVVDDDEDNLKLFTIVLEYAGFRVMSYIDPLEALNEFKPGYYDLAILDYLMPNLNGIELSKKLRQKDESIKILILTASHERIHISHNQESVDVILKVVRKPIAIPKLLDEIYSILGLEKKSVAT